mmetsp:Transcript_436/g.530  ORF Transcript_436/g.530 Transcript_436/m.530 type:complete len:89 (+) Transcript_436:91-357(+)|eukprot:CAMPEP_0174274936 /NCGR_PEP_ID=MMETSP0439-20130205/59542_1 /TAXON_ID=0 /ORGANISM="Stereomyxa ramosa, Strain Chinc5" /LENGTH=88 /DNA_ID=CAMNT_0015366989 /DNA_START=546 /DNA_END=812 /DNA_ORIENTATION=-
MADWEYELDTITNCAYSLPVPILDEDCSEYFEEHSFEEFLELVAEDPKEEPETAEKQPEETENKKKLEKKEQKRKGGKQLWKKLRTFK